MISSNASPDRSASSHQTENPARLKHIGKAAGGLRVLACVRDEDVSHSAASIGRIRAIAGNYQ